MDPILLTDDDIHAIIIEYRDRVFDSDISIYRDYAAGNHKLILTAKQKIILKNLLGNKFSDNACHQIIFEAANRIKLNRWSCEDKPVEEFLAQFYLLAGIGYKQGSVHYNALRDGDAAVAVDWSTNSKRTQIYVEKWWDGDTGVFIIYDEFDEKWMSVKEWCVKTTSGERLYRRNVWMEGSVRRFVSRDRATWERYRLPSDNPDESIWPLPRVNPKDSNPLAVPHVHFPNASREHELYGASELSGGVIGMQDQLNDMQWGLSASTRLTAYQMYWGSGVTPKMGKDGKAIPPNMEPGAMFTSPKPEARFGVLQAGSIEQQLKAYDKKLQRMAQVTGTPIHTITGGDWPSGDAILRAELPAVSKARRQIDRFNAAWVEVGHRAVELTNAFSDKALNEDIEGAMVIGKFDDPEKRDIVSRSLVVHNMAANISIRESLRILGYQETDVERIAKEILDESAEKQALLMKKMQEQAALGGGPFGGGPGGGAPGGGGKGASNAAGDGKPTSGPGKQPAKA